MFFFFEPGRIAEALERIRADSSWVCIGEVLASLEQHGAVDSQAVPLAQHVLDRLEKLGRPLGVQQLRKIRRCYLFLRDQASVDPFLYEACPLSGVEVVSRIFALDRQAGLTHLERLRQGQPYTEIMDVYDALKASAPAEPTQDATPFAPRRRGRPRQRANLLEQEALHWIESEPHAFFGPRLRHFFSTTLSAQDGYRAVDLLFRYAEEGEESAHRLAAFEIKQVGMASGRERQLIITQASVAASFYDVYWLVLGDVRSGKAFSNDVAMLRLGNVGVAVLGPDGDKMIERRPSGPPLPDRRSS